HQEPGGEEEPPLAAEAQVEDGCQQRHACPITASREGRRRRRRGEGQGGSPAGGPDRPRKCRERESGQAAQERVRTQRSGLDRKPREAQLTEGGGSAGGGAEEPPPHVEQQQGG